MGHLEKYGTNIEKTQKGADEERGNGKEGEREEKEITEEEKAEILSNLEKGIIFQPDKKDLINYLFQFIILLLVGSALFVPGLVFLSRDLYSLILIISGALVYLYVVIRTICVFSYRIEIFKNHLRWRNVFWWNDVPNEEITNIIPKNGYFFYLIKVGGIAQVGVEVIKIETEEKDYWVRAYPLRRLKGDELVSVIKCWVENESNSKNAISEVIEGMS